MSSGLFGWSGRLPRVFSASIWEITTKYENIAALREGSCRNAAIFAVVI
jgi:hypothetical protein